MANTIRQFEEKVVPNEITLMKWSDRMDLIILANNKGEVYLHRLTWQRVWSLPARGEEIMVTDMTWRPDGKIIAIAYSCGEVVLVEVESKSILYTIDAEDEVSCMIWHQEKDKPGESSSKQKASMGDESKYLPNLPSLTSESKSQTEDLVYQNFVESQTNLNIFVMGTKSGMLQLSIFGLFNCIRINVSESIGKPCTVVSTHLSENLDLLYIMSCDCNKHVTMSVLDTTILRTHSKELFAVALKFGHLYSLLAYLDNTMLALNEAWEIILMEMDAKLSKYASNVPEGAVSADFLDLLMFGIPSDEMEEFLMHDLTDKGLKKLGQSIELSYSNIQKLLHKHLTKVTQNITYHLAELRGMSRFAHRFKVTGLNESMITKAIRSVGAFLVKGIEVQQVINQSMTNYKAFFRWLYVVILRMMDEQVPAEIPKMAQQDLAYIVEFLQNFDSIGTHTSDKKNKFHLERLGQYLVDAPLKIVQSNKNNFWYEFLEEHECIAEDDMIINFDETKSLVQQHKDLVKAIENIFVEPKERIARNFGCKGYYACLQVTNLKNMRVSFFNCDENTTLIAFVDIRLLADGVFFIEVDQSEEELKMKSLYLFPFQVPEYSTPDSSTGTCKILDVKFYSNTYISLLLQDSATDSAYLCQTPIEHLRLFMTPAQLDLYNFVLDPEIGKVDIADLVANVVKKIDGMLVSRFAVSGNRHVCAVLSENHRKVQLFEMEAEEEEEEADETYMTANTTRDDSIAQESLSPE